MTAPSTIEEDAVAWAVRASDPAFAEWEALAAWLDGDPARNLAYDQVRAALAEAEEALLAAPAATVVPFPGPATRPAQRPARWSRVAAGAALAASIAGVWLVVRPDPRPAWRVVETAPGRARTLELRDGSRIDLAGGSRLRLDPANPRGARIEHGRAVFTVRHDAAAPFQVVAGSHRIVDAGTTFEVAHAALLTTVAVAEGLVIVDPARDAVRLTPGDAGEWRPDRAPTLTRLAPDAIAQWRYDRMTYRGAPLTRVAADLSAALGQPIVVGAGLDRRRFDGTLTPATLKGRPEDVAGLLNVRVRSGPAGWELAPR